MKRFAKIVSLSLCIMLLLAMAGCGSSSSSTAAVSSSTPASAAPVESPAAPAQSSAAASTSKDISLVDRASKLLTAQGREYDKLVTAKMNETLTSSFFDFSISSAETAATIGEYAPQTEGYQFLLAEVTVKNIFEEAIPVGNYDFYVIWNDGEDVAYESFFDEMYPDDVELAVGETLSGMLVFEIPADATDVMVGYDEVWDDEFVGNSFMVSLDL